MSDEELLGARVTRHQGGVRHAQSQMPTEKMSSFPTVRKEPAESWADSNEAAETDQQLRSNGNLKSEQEKAYKAK